MFSNGIKPPQWIRKTATIVFALIGLYLIYSGVDESRIRYIRNDYIELSYIAFSTLWIIIGLFSFWVFIEVFNLSKKILVVVIFIVFLFVAATAYEAIHPSSPYMSLRKPSLNEVNYKTTGEWKSPSGEYIVVHSEFTGWEILSIKRSNEEIIVSDLIDSQKDDIWPKLRELGLDDRGYYKLDVANWINSSTFVLNIQFEHDYDYDYEHKRDQKFEAVVNAEKGRLDISSLKATTPTQQPKPIL